MSLCLPAYLCGVLARQFLWRGKLSVPAPPVEDAAVRRPVKFMLIRSTADLSAISVEDLTGVAPEDRTGAYLTGMANKKLI